MSIGYVIILATMGIKWCLLFEYSGTVWIGLANHFFHNCVVTNLFHVVRATGVDELQIERVVIGELTSFLVVVIFMKHKRN